MNTLFARGSLRGALVLAVVTAVTAVGATTAQAAAPKLTLTALSFAQSSVDVSSQSVTDDLTWTIKNTDQGAEGLFGSVTLRMRSSVTGGFLGHDQVVTFDLNSFCCNGVDPSGTPQLATFTYHFAVPQWADATTATWVVTNLSAEWDSETLSVGAAKLATYASTVSATTAIDSSGPSIDQIGFDSGFPQRPYAYVGAGPDTVGYEFDIQDWQSGFWKGSLKLAGPGGSSITTTFTWVYPPQSTGIACGSVSSFDIHQVECDVPITLPAGSAAGSWRVAQIVVFDNAGAQATYKNPTAPSITVTSDATLTASNFTITPTTTNDWRGSTTGSITFDTSGARKGVTAVVVDFDTFLCSQFGNPSVSGSTVTQTFTIDQNTPSCTVTGIAVIDGAGDVSVYGSQYNGAPDPGLTVVQTPDTTPPVVTGATLTPSSVPLSQVSNVFFNLNVQAEVLTAPINSFTAYVYDSNGNTITSTGGGTFQAADGSVQISIELPWWTGTVVPGTYTVGFLLTDEGQLTSVWNVPGRPDSQPIPGGPVTLTVTEG